MKLRDKPPLARTWTQSRPGTATWQISDEPRPSCWCSMRAHDPNQFMAPLWTTVAAFRLHLLRYTISWNTDMR